MPLATWTVRPTILRTPSGWCLFQQLRGRLECVRTEAEVIEFCGTLGLKFTPEEGCQALDEMEMDDSRDGQVTLDE